jgi:hypothetical protein
MKISLQTIGPIQVSLYYSEAHYHAVLAQIWYDQPVESNGIYFTTGFGPPEGDMSEWDIHSSAGNWSTSYRHIWSTVYHMKLPIERGVDYVFDWTMEEPVAVLVATNSINFAAGFLLSVVLALFGRETYVSGVLAGVFSLSTILRTVSGVGFAAITNNFVLANSIWITTPQVYTLI